MTDGKTTKSAHELRYEAETGFFVFVQRGAMSAEDAQKLLVTFRDAARAGEATFTLSDARNAGSPTPEARKIVAEAASDLGESYLAAFGGTFATRVVQTMLFKAVSILSPRYVMAVFADETEARAWLSDKRRAYLARTGKA